MEETTAAAVDYSVFGDIFQFCNSTSLGPFNITTYFIISIILMAVVLFIRGNKK